MDGRIDRSLFVYIKLKLLLFCNTESWHFHGLKCISNSNLWTDVLWWCDTDPINWKVLEIYWCQTILDFIQYRGYIFSSLSVSIFAAEDLVRMDIIGLWSLCRFRSGEHSEISAVDARAVQLNCPQKYCATQYMNPKRYLGNFSLQSNMEKL